MQTPRFNLRRVGTVFVSTVAAAGLLTAFHYRGGTPEERLNRAVDEITTRLDLTEDQQDKLEEVKNEILKVREKNKGERLRIIKEMKSLVLSDRLDPMKFRRLVERKQRLINREMRSVFSTIQEFHASLTDEQKAQIVNRLEEIEQQLRGGEEGTGEVEEDIDNVDDVRHEHDDDNDDFR